MNELDYKRDNIVKSSIFYEESLENLEKYFKGEDGEVVLQNAQLVRDGLSRIISIKKRELNSLENKSKEK